MRLGYAQREDNQISREIFEVFVPCDQDTLTLQTDRQTDGHTTCRGNTAVCVTSRGNNRPRFAIFSVYSLIHSSNTLKSTLKCVGSIKLGPTRAL